MEKGTGTNAPARTGNLKARAAEERDPQASDDAGPKFLVAA